MRVLHIITRYLGGGSERDLLAQMEFERAQGDEVHLAVGRDSLVAEDARPYLVATVPTLIRGIDPISDLRAYRALRALITTGRYDVVFTHQSKAGALGRLAARGRAGAVAHVVSMAAFGAGYPRHASMAFAAAERWCARYTDLILTVGHELRRDYLAAGVGKETQYRVVRSPIDVGRFLATRDLDPAARAQIRGHFGIPEGTRVLTSVGALEPRKRHELLLRTLSPLLASDATLLFAGDGAERRRLAELAVSLGVSERARFLGHIPNVHELLAVTDVLVHASTAEGVPQVMVQALASGVPIVATQVTGMRELPGAPVTLVPANGSGLLEAVKATLAAPGAPLDGAVFDEWRLESVERQIAAVRDELSARLRNAEPREAVDIASS
jgi:glycosyltransferase involved in cell wall biosynthesis